jgi:ABC-type multidrug transport system fused ATPase/permease subunit
MLQSSIFRYVPNKLLYFDKEKKLLRIGLTFSGKLSTKELSAAFSELTTQAGLVVLQSSQLLIAIVSASLFLIYGSTLAPKEMVIGFVLLILIGLPFKKISRKIRTSGKELVSNFTSVNESLLLGLKNSYFIKLYNLSQIEIDKGLNFLKNYQNSYLSYGLASSTLASFPVLSGVFIIATLTLIGAEYFHTPGIKLMTFFYVFVRFAQAMSDSLKITSQIRLNFESFKRLYQWSIKEDDGIKSNYNDFKLNYQDFKNIEAKNLTFSYPEGEKVIDNLQFKLVPSDIYLIKGESGSGKSTLLNLILGLYSPTSGKIFYDDIEGVPKNFSELIGYVGPEPYMIPGTIKENMFYGLNEHKSDEEIWSALKLAHLDDTISKLPLKLEEPLSDKTELSTGQKQRLSIARALLRNPKILVLDEATSNLDPITEDNIVQNIKELSNDKVTIVVSHRDSFDKVATKTLEL